MSEFPLEPQLSKTLLSSPKYKCIQEVLTIVSCMSSPNVFLRPKQKLQEATDAHAKFINAEGDHITIMNAFHEYKRKNMDVDWCYKNFLNYRHLKAADDVREQLKQLMIKVDIPVSDDFPIQPNIPSIKKCLLTGYFTHIALLQKNNVYLTSKNCLIQLKTRKLLSSILVVF